MADRPGSGADSAVRRLAALELILEEDPAPAALLAPPSLELQVLEEDPRAAPTGPLAQQPVAPALLLVSPGLELQLQQATEYARLCERRLMQLSPGHVLPVLAAHLSESLVATPTVSQEFTITPEAEEARRSVPKPTVWLPPHHEARLERSLREERAAHAELRRQYAASESMLHETRTALRDLRSRLEERDRELAAAARRHQRLNEGGAIGDGVDASRVGSCVGRADALVASADVVGQCRNPGCSGAASCSTRAGTRAAGPHSGAVCSGAGGRAGFSRPPPATIEGLRADRARLQRELAEVNIAYIYT